MTVDLKWLLPFVGPFVVLGQLRAVCWAAGAEIQDPQAAAFAAFLIGTIGGIIGVLVMSNRGIKWAITIGKRAKPDVADTFSKQNIATGGKP